jgi:hypothetical protein
VSSVPFGTDSLSFCPPSRAVLVPFGTSTSRTEAPTASPVAPGQAQSPNTTGGCLAGCGAVLVAATVVTHQPTRRGVNCLDSRHCTIATAPVRAVRGDILDSKNFAIVTHSPRGKGWRLRSI